MNMYETFAAQCNLLLHANKQAIERIELLANSGAIYDNRVSIECVNNNVLMLSYNDIGGWTRHKDITNMATSTLTEGDVLNKVVAMLGDLIKDKIVYIALHLYERGV